MSLSSLSVPVKEAIAHAHPTSLSPACAVVRFSLPTPARGTVYWTVNVPGADSPRWLAHAILLFRPYRSSSMQVLRGALRVRNDATPALRTHARRACFCKLHERSLARVPPLGAAQINACRTASPVVKAAIEDYMLACLLAFSSLPLFVLQSLSTRHSRPRTNVRCDLTSLSALRSPPCFISPCPQPELPRRPLSQRGKARSPAAPPNSRLSVQLSRAESATSSQYPLHTLPWHCTYSTAPAPHSTVLLLLLLLPASRLVTAQNVLYV